MGTKLVRAPLIQFGKDGSASDFGQFGSLADGSKVTSKTMATLQANAAWLLGWQDAVIANKRPAYQDFNGLQFVHSYELCYLLQTGVPEWNAATEYFIGSIVNDGTGVLYKSIQDNNTNHATSDGAWWSVVVTTFTPSAANALAGSQIQMQYTQDASYQTTAGTVGAKDAAFPNTEGGQFLSRTITPNDASNLLEITVMGYFQENTNTGAFVKVGVFQNGVTNAIAMGWVDATAGGAAGGTSPVVIQFVMAAGTTSAITFTVRAGCDVGQTDMNGYNGGRAGGGVLFSSIIVKETKV